MSQQIEYSSFRPDSNKKPLNNMALANRALSASALQNKPVKCDNCSSHIYPASKATFQMKNGDDVLKSQFVSIENNYNTKEKPISVLFQKVTSKDKHEINVLTNDPFNDHESDYYIGDYTLLSTQQNVQNKKNDDQGYEEEENKYKMDIYTNIYVGSITIISLYLVYKLLLK